MRYIYKTAHRALKYAWAFWLTLFILPLIQLFWNNALIPTKNFPDLLSKSILAVLFFPTLHLVLTLSILGALLLINISAWILTCIEKSKEGQHNFVKKEAPIAQRRGIDAFILSVQWSPDGKYLACVGSEGVVEIWGGETFSRVKQLAPEDEPVDWLRSLAWSADSQLLAVGGEDRQVRIWNIETGTIQNTLHHPADLILALGWSSQGVMAVTENGWSAFFSPTTDKWQQMAPTRSPLQVAAWSRQTEMLATASVEGEINIQYRSGSRSLTSLNPEVQQVRVLSWNTTDTCLAVGYEDGNVQIWEVDQRTKLIEWSTHQQDLQAICWMHRGHSIISADGSGIIKIWQILTGQLEREFDTHLGPITALAVSPGIQFLCSAHEKGTLAIWKIPKRFR